MITLENALSDNLFKLIRTKILSDQFPWYPTTTVYGELENSDDSIPENFSYYHIAMRDKTYNSDIAPILHAALLEILQKLNEPVEEVFRIRIGSIPFHPDGVINNAHVDWLFPHKTALLYINDSDGDTILYNKTYDINSGLSLEDYYNKIENKLEIAHKSTPKQNKFILFNGLIYHSSTMPKTKFRRVAVNFNFK